MHSNRRLSFPISSSSSTSLTWLLLLLLLRTSHSVPDIFTTPEKMAAVALQESTFLDQLRSYIGDQYGILETLTRFLNDREQTFHLMSNESRIKMAEHPNGAFIFIKKYSNDWHSIINENPTFPNNVNHLKSILPTYDDYTGALNALIRLQRTYRLRVEDMYVGNYSGHLGPPLEPLDAWVLGRQAFLNNHWKECIEWLELAKVKTREEVDRAVDKDFLLAWQNYAMALLGRSYLFINRPEEARAIYNECIQSGNLTSDMEQLGRELNQSGLTTYNTSMSEIDINMTELCTRDKEQRVAAVRSFHICRYKPSLYIPYLRFEEEILSIEPFASIFYNVISDQDAEMITTFMRGKLHRGQVSQGKEGTFDKERISDVGWLHENNLDVALKLLKRIQAMTWLEVSDSESEEFQVVNYGLGGHYSAHWDGREKHLRCNHFEFGVEEFRPGKAAVSLMINISEPCNKLSFSRLATFLIYLSDVQKGGHTVFLYSGISVAPKKGMALFWYNYEPSLETDILTYHSGCPVLMGQKWIVNKWILSCANIFARPCGPRPNSTQLDIEDLMYSRSRK